MTSGVSPDTGLAPLVPVADPDALAHLVAALALAPVVAVDTESNSLHAYRERVCLIQISTFDADYIVDPIALPDLSALGPVRLEFPILSLHPGLRQRGVAPDVWPTLSRA